MTIEVLEHNGIYTAYRRTVKRGSDGKLFDSVTRIDIPLPPPHKSEWAAWATTLTKDSLEVGLQVFFDKWNFGNGNPLERKIYQCLFEERQSRRDAAGLNVTVNPKTGMAVSNGDGNIVFSRNSKGQATISGKIPFPVIRK